MPTRCNRGFYCRSYCLLNMFRAPTYPSSGAQEYYTVVAACGISCCGFQVAGLVWSWGLCPVCRMLVYQHPANQTHNIQRFLLQILLLAQHVSGTTMPIVRSSRVLYSGCCLWYFVLWFSSCWSGVELRVMCLVCRMLVNQHPANRTHNPQHCLIWNAVNGHQWFSLIFATAAKRPQFGLKKMMFVPPNPPLKRPRLLLLLFCSSRMNQDLRGTQR